MKRIAVLSLLLSFSLCVLAHSHSPTQKENQKDYSFVKATNGNDDVTIVKAFGLNDWIVIDPVTPASDYRLYDEYASGTLDEVIPVANAPPEHNQFKFGYSKRY